MFWEVNITFGDLIISFVGAFFGFGLTILIELFFHRMSKRSLINLSVNNIKLELEDLQNNLSKCNEDDTLIIDIPVWESFVQSSNIMLFAKKKYYNELLKTYSEIKLLSEIEKRYMNEIETKDRKELIDARVSLKKRIERVLPLLTEKNVKNVNGKRKSNGNNN